MLVLPLLELEEELEDEDELLLELVDDDELELTCGPFPFPPQAVVSNPIAKMTPAFEFNNFMLDAFHLNLGAFADSSQKPKRF